MKDIITDEIALGGRCSEIDIRVFNKKMREVVKEIKDTMRKNDLTSLSAPAIGYDVRIFCIKFADLEIKTFINPIIANAKGLELSRETCTSIPGKEYIRPRHNDIEVFYQTPMGKTESRQIVGMAARVFQHEIDHLDGLLISDVGLEVDEMFDNASEEEREEVIKMYLDSLDIKQKELESEIENDPELKQIHDGVKFMEGIARGEVQLATHEEIDE